MVSGLWAQAPSTAIAAMRAGAVHRRALRPSSGRRSETGGIPAPPGRGLPGRIVLALAERDVVPEVAARHAGQRRQREDVADGVVVPALPLLGVEVGQGPVEPAQFVAQLR